MATYLDFDTPTSNTGRTKNAEHANIGEDHNISNYIDTYGTDPVVLFRALGLTYTGTITLHVDSQYYTITFNNVTFSGMSRISKLKFVSHNGTSLPQIRVNDNESDTMVMSNSTFYFDELNFLLNPRYLYRVDNTPYFDHITHNNTSISGTYNYYDNVEPINPSSVTVKDRDIPSPYVLYGMPNYLMKNKNIYSAGTIYAYAGGNPYKYTASVFGAPINDPPEQFNYTDLIPYPIFITGQKTTDGYNYVSYSFSGNSIVVVQNKPGVGQRTVSYDLTDCVLTKHTRSSNNFTIRSGSGFAKDYMYYHVGDGYDNSGRHIYLGASNADAVNTAIPCTINYTMPLTVTRYNGSTGVPDTSSIWSRLHTTQSFTQDLTTTNTAKGDGANSSNLARSVRVYVGRHHQTKDTKYDTKYQIKIRGIIYKLPGETLTNIESVACDGDAYVYGLVEEMLASYLTPGAPGPNKYMNPGPSDFRDGYDASFYPPTGMLVSGYDLFIRTNTRPSINFHIKITPRSYSTFPAKITLAALQKTVQWRGDAHRSYDTGDGAATSMDCTVQQGQNPTPYGSQYIETYKKQGKQVGHLYPTMQGLYPYAFVRVRRVDDILKLEWFRAKKDSNDAEWILSGDNGPEPDIYEFDLSNYYFYSNAYTDDCVGLVLGTPKGYFKEN